MDGASGGGSDTATPSGTDVPGGRTDTGSTPRPDTYVVTPDTFVLVPDAHVRDVVRPPGDAGEAGDGGEDPIDVSVDPPDVPVVEPTCSRNGFRTARRMATTEAFGIQYAALNTAGTPYDVMLVQIYRDFDGPTSPGTYSLDGINYADCGLCLLAFSGCNGQQCEKTWYAEAGSVDITAIGTGVGQQFAATLHDVVFDEVTINDTTWVSTPVPGGQTWCVGEYAYDEEIQDGSGADCDRPDIVCVGETVADFSLQNCETEDFVSWYALAESKKAVWLVLTAGWCPACHEYMPVALAAHAENAAAGLEMMVVLGENTAGGQPTLAYCRGYAGQYAEDASLFYIDHDGEFSYATTFLNLWPYLDDNGAFGLPWNGVLNAVTKEYAYGDGGGGDLEATFTTLLAK